MIRWPARILFILGLVLIGVWFKHNTQARALRSAEAKRFDADGALGVRHAVRLLRAPWCPETLELGVFGRIQIPRLGISALIAEGAEPAQINRAVEHVATSVFPGQPGNCTLAGHRDNLLHGLGDVRDHDIILIDTLQGTYTYLVEPDRVRGRHRVDALAPGGPSLTIVTSYPFQAVDHTPERFMVRARLVELVTAGVH